MYIMYKVLSFLSESLIGDKVEWSFGQHTELIIIIVVGSLYIFIVSNKSAVKYLLKSTYIMLKNK